MRDHDFEQRLRGALDHLPAPSEEVTQRARRRALRTVGEHAGPRPRVRRGRARRGLLSLAIVVLTVSALGGFALGRTSAPDARTRVVRTGLTATGGPGFVPARGWNTVQTDGAAVFPGGTASAATVELRDAPRALPSETIASLGPDDVLIQATLYGRADFVRPSWSSYPPRALPLRTPHGDAAASWEGGSGWRYVITGRVQGWLLEVVVYFGAQPSAAVRRTADAELRRLLLPSPCPAAEALPATARDGAVAAVKRMLPRAIDRSVEPPVDYRDPRVAARAVRSDDAVPAQCRAVPLGRIVAVDVRYPHLAGRSALAQRTYLVSRQDGRDVVWARLR